jgi:hypothetical protein
MEWITIILMFVSVLAGFAIGLGFGVALWADFMEKESKENESK